MKLSVIVPVYNEAENLSELFNRLTQTFQQDLVPSSYELIFVDDGSTDGSSERLADLSRQDSHVHLIRLSRNFGQHVAIKAGIDACSGDFIVIMDGDLQDPPEKIPTLYRALTTEDLDIVMSVRKKRQDSWQKQLSSWLFYKLINRISEIHMIPNQTMLRIFTREVGNLLKQLNEIDQNNGALLAWMGFKTGVVLIEHEQRARGKSKYSLHKSIALAVKSILSFSSKPLIYISGVGIFIACISFIFGIIILVMAIFFNVASGWPSLVILLTFLIGVSLSAHGVVGLYVGRIYNQSLGRPLYIVRKTYETSSIQKDTGAQTQDLSSQTDHEHG